MNEIELWKRIDGNTAQQRRVADTLEVISRQLHDLLLVNTYPALKDVQAGKVTEGA